MKYALNFAKHTSIIGLILYLIKFMLEDVIEYRMISCIWMVVFSMVIYLTTIIDSRYLKRMKK